MRVTILAALLMIGWLAVTRASQPPDELPPGIVVLKVAGGIDFERIPNWTARQTLLPGTILSPTDLIYSDQAALLTLCPDGRLLEFVPSDLRPVDVVQCPSGPAIIGNPGMQTLRLQRGGRQDQTIPYLITPRATVVRSAQVELVWNAVANVEHYQLRLQTSSGTVWTSDSLLPAAVVEGAAGRAAVPVALEADVPYTVEICVLFTNLQRQCTTDSAWSEAADAAFYYHPAPEIEGLDTSIQAALGQDTPESLYARAVVWSQAVAQLSTPDEPVGYYQDAINLLETLLRQHPDSALAQSPELYNRLGELYRSVRLPLSANRAYARALELAPPGTEAKAFAAVGDAITTTQASGADALYAEALEAMAGYLSQHAFLEEFERLCGMIGDLCRKLPQCSTVPGAACDRWWRGTRTDDPVMT